MAGYRKLGLPTDQRKAMLRGLVTSFLKYGKIEAKNNACIDYCNKNNLYFKFVFDYELNEFNQKLLNERDSLEE